ARRSKDERPADNSRPVGTSVTARDDQFKVRRPKSEIRNPKGLPIACRSRGAGCDLTGWCSQSARLSEAQEVSAQFRLQRPICQSRRRSHGRRPVFKIIMSTLTETNVRLFASAKSWIEGEAVRQLYATAKFDGMRQAAG